MIKAVVLIPVHDNRGRRFPKTVWIAFEERFLQFGGVSRMRRVEGIWRDADRVYRDTSWEYVVALASWRQLASWLDVVEWARVAFGQEALYIEVNGAPEIIGSPGG
ncbi:MAG: hypothetical protein ACRDI2_22830 [Chloroflexota bacterium]